MRNAPWSKAGPDFVKGRCANSGWLGLEHWSPVPNFLKLEDLGAIFERPGCDFRKAFSASHALLLSARGLARGIKLKMKPVWSVERSMACGRACGGRGRSVLPRLARQNPSLALAGANTVHLTIASGIAGCGWPDEFCPTCGKQARRERAPLITSPHQFLERCGSVCDSSQDQGPPDVITCAEPRQAVLTFGLPHAWQRGCSGC